MDARTRLQLDALNKCVFRPGSWEKRYARDLYMLGPYDLLTRNQLAALASLYWRYRNQINAIRSNYPTVNYPVPVQPEVDPVLAYEDRNREQVRKDVARVDKRTLAAMEKLSKWNRKVNGNG